MQDWLPASLSVILIQLPLQRVSISPPMSLLQIAPRSGLCAESACVESIAGDVGAGAAGQKAFDIFDMPKKAKLAPVLVFRSFFVKK